MTRVFREPVGTLAGRVPPTDDALVRAAGWYDPDAAAFDETREHAPPDRGAHRGDEAREDVDPWIDWN